MSPVCWNFLSIPRDNKQFISSTLITINVLYRFAVAKIIQFVIVVSILLYTVFYYQPPHGKIANATVDRNYSESNLPLPTGPIIIDPNLKTEVVFRGLHISH